MPTNLSKDHAQKTRYYFQIQELGSGIQNVNKNASSVYRIDFNEKHFAPVVFDKFLTGMQKFVLETKNYSPFNSQIIYLVENLDLFKDPLSIEQIKLKNKNIKKFIYKLQPDDLPLYSSYKLVDDSFIDIFIDMDEMKFIGYSLRKNDIEMFSLQIEDDILKLVDIGSHSELFE